VYAWTNIALVHRMYNLKLVQIQSGAPKMWKLNVRLMRTIPKIVMEYTWSLPIETIIVSMDKPIKQIIPDKILNISWLFE